ncbi:hypothetical protein QVD17_11195 [Tagetes erecta]|uniref:Peptidoglycan binding-like domain-containing protein n=1 Tax=Tagetes erecta TaxID=13708 RepID=A0AAD8KXG0_TARER|nr:hypothetical protein QVD17_11195 [Tagetes erecta]
MRWLREEQRWLREEQRWIREERRWEAEREALLNQIKHLKLQHPLNQDPNPNPNPRLLEKEMIPETASSASPLELLNQQQQQELVDEEQVEEEEKAVVVAEKQEQVIINKTKTLRVGSEGDEVQMLQEALLKLGFYCGEEDEEFASFSTGTERAVKTWQSSIGVPETGIMTTDLLQTLFQNPTSTTFKEGANGVAIPSKQVPELDVSEHRVFLLGENRWEDSSRLKNRQTQTQTNTQGGLKIKCITCRGEGHLLCLECDGTGEPNIEPQFLEWVGEDTKCPYCEGNGHTICDVCQGTGVGVGGA